MMGSKARIFAPQRSVTLDDLVPQDHFYRHLDRTLDLSFVRDLVRDCYASLGRPSIDKRKVVVEPLFGEAQAWHGLERFGLRGLPKVNGEALLIAAGQNLKRLLAALGWGRRPFPCGAPGVRVAPYPAQPAEQRGLQQEEQQPRGALVGR